MQDTLDFSMEEDWTFILLIHSMEEGVCLWYLIFSEFDFRSFPFLGQLFEVTI